MIIFDPKYKLSSELVTDDETDGRPKSVDVDAMHTYRDAIRTAVDGARAVTYAGILYPGATERFGRAIAAIRAQPGEPEQLRASVAEQLERSLAPGAQPRPAVRAENG